MKTRWIWLIILMALAGCSRPPVQLPEWSEDVTAAATAAREGGKMLLLNFSGSDWCHWCVRLEEEVFSQPAFRQYADEHLVMALIDFPRRRPQSEEVRAQNERLLRHFGVRGFPTLLLFSPDGEWMARLGYQPGGPEAFIASIRQAQARQSIGRPDAEAGPRLPL